MCVAGCTAVVVGVGVVVVVVGFCVVLRALMVVCSFLKGTSIGQVIYGAILITFMLIGN